MKEVGIELLGQLKRNRFFLIPLLAGVGTCLYSISIRYFLKLKMNCF